jgi:uncharacterized repeat protein (TIGR03847 family)
VLIEIDPLDRITAGAVGEPGQRVFYLQARGGGRLITLLVEKRQVELLSSSLVEILARAGKATGEGPSEEEMELEEPLEPEWRAGRLSIGYDEGRDLVLLEAEEVGAEEEETGPEEPEAQPEEAPQPPQLRRMRFWASREQALALARHGAAVCAAGRPTCQVCGNPIDPDGHVCPGLNGHREVGWA